jgi:hypothetical protein
VGTPGRTWERGASGERIVGARLDRIAGTGGRGALRSRRARALNEAPIPVTAALCFVDAPRPLPAEPFMLSGVWVGWPDVLSDLVNRPGLLDPEAVQATARLLDARLPPS